MLNIDSNISIDVGIGVGIDIVNNIDIYIRIHVDISIVTDIGIDVDIDIGIDIDCFPKDILLIRITHVCLTLGYTMITTPIALVSNEIQWYTAYWRAECYINQRNN